MFSLIKVLIKILVLTSVLTILYMNPIEEVVTHESEEEQDKIFDIIIDVDIQIDLYWPVSIQRKRGHRCGGSLIESQWVLTAAHYFNSTRITPTNCIEVKAGTQILSESVPYYNVSRIIFHPLYSRDGISNDIALIELETPIPLREKNPLPVNTIRLPESHNELVAYNLTTFGWGVTETGNLSLEQIMRCNAAYDIPGEEVIIDSMICAGGQGKDVCQGDSGGGLIQWDDKGNPTIVGIVSFGNGCGDPHYPGVYTRVSSFVDWIRSVIKNNT